MKVKFAWMLIAAFVLCGALADTGTIRAAWFRADITPPVGTKLAGYGSFDISVGVADPLEACGVVLDDGTNRVALISYDILGLDSATIRDFRQTFAKTLGVESKDVMLTCTHTHEGPHTRSYIEGLGDMELLPGAPARNLDTGYLAKLRRQTDDALAEIAQGKAWKKVRVGFHSTVVDVNLNRNFVTADNCASFAAYNRKLAAAGTGYADKELGVLALFDSDSDSLQPLWVLGNYAAHPLDAHSFGTGGLRISADFPGVFRCYLTEETGVAAMFVQGAAGDLFTKYNELGRAGMRKTGEELGMAAVGSVLDIQRNADRFVMGRSRVGAVSKHFKSKIRKHYRKYFDRDEIDLEVQCLAVGDVCFVGVPGEAICELGRQIKWNSPFRKTFIAYCSTGYAGYLAPPNFVAAGGYEGTEQRFASRDVLKLVNVATDAAFELRNRLFPEDSDEDGDAYPDSQRLPLCNLPGMVRPGRFQK